MLTVTIILAAVISVAAIGYVVLPLYYHHALNLSFRSGDDTFLEDEQLTELMVRKDAALLSIKELEFDYQTGKLSQPDFDRFNHRLRQQAMGLLRQIERRAPRLVELDQSLEQEIAKAREVESDGPKATEKASGPSDVTEKARTTSTEQCPTCNNPIASADNFCAKCGANLLPAE